MAENDVLVFEGGSLTVKRDGPVTDRDGALVLDISLPSWEAESATIEVPHSELIGLRDFLNRLFPVQS